MKLSTTIAMIALFCANWVSAQDLRHFQYLVRVPATGKSCTQEAQILASRLAAAKEKPVNLVGQCVSSVSFKDNNEVFGLYTLAVDYDALDPIAKFQTTLQTEAGDEVAYPTYHSCLDDLTTQAGIYESANGPTVLSAYCAPFSLGGFALKIDALGYPEMHLFHFKNSINERTSSRSGWNTMIRKILTNANVIMAKQMGSNYFYYSKQEVSLLSEAVVSLGSLDECQAQVTEANAMYTKFGAKNILLACNPYLGTKVSLDIVADVYSGPISDYGANSEYYYTFEECMSSRALVEKNNGAQPFFAGAFCSPDIMHGQGYHIETFRKY